MNLPVGRDEAFCYLLMVMRKRGGPKVLVAMAKETENESERSYSGWRPEQKPVTVESAMPWFELALGFGEGVEKPRYSVTAYCLYCLAAKRTSDSIARFWLAPWATTGAASLRPTREARARKSGWRRPRATSNGCRSWSKPSRMYGSCCSTVTHSTSSAR